MFYSGKVSDYINQLETTELIILVVLLYCLIVQSFYYIAVFSRLAFYKDRHTPAENKPVSIIICARNELENLRKHLLAVLEQQYNQFQVIVVNDCSWDESLTYLQELEGKYPHLKIVNIPMQDRYETGKKFAVTLGIKAAKYDYLLFTDADCIPSSKNWLAHIQSNFLSKTEIVLGYGAYEKKNSLLNKLIRFDSFFIAFQYLSFALSGFAYMGVGRNLAYKKDIFFRSKGFAKHQHIASGDDDLFVNENSRHGNTRICIDEGAFTVSVPKNSFVKWMRQKRRHVTTYPLYKPLHKLALGLQISSHGLFYISLAALILFTGHWELALGVYVFRFLMQAVIMGKAMRKLNEADLVFYIPFFDILQLSLYVITFVATLFTSGKKWK